MKEYQEIIKDTKLRSEISKSVKNHSEEYFNQKIEEAKEILANRPRLKQVVYRAYYGKSSFSLGRGCTCLVVDRRYGIGLRFRAGGYGCVHTY
jgi:hypothetical protein